MTRRPTKLSHGVLTLELFLVLDRGGDELLLLASVPAREEAREFRWPVVCGKIDGPALADVIGLVGKLVTDSAVMAIGIQEALPLG